MPEFVDRMLKCSDCGTDFIFTAGEQQFYQDKNFRNEPKRCKACKGQRGYGHSGGGSGRQKVETLTVCSLCGKQTTVPFKPTQGRPVFCRDCFLERRAAAGAGSAGD